MGKNWSARSKTTVRSKRFFPLTCASSSIACVNAKKFTVFFTQGQGPVQVDSSPSGGPSLPSAQLLGISH